MRFFGVDYVGGANLCHCAPLRFLDYCTRCLSWSLCVSSPSLIIACVAFVVRWALLPRLRLCRLLHVMYILSLSASSPSLDLLVVRFWFLWVLLRRLSIIGCGAFDCHCALPRCRSHCWSLSLSLCASTPSRLLHAVVLIFVIERFSTVIA